MAYATSYDQPACLRPWQLSWRSDTGCSGFLEPEQALCIMEVMMSEGSLDSIFLKCPVGSVHNVKSDG